MNRQGREVRQGRIRLWGFDSLLFLLGDLGGENFRVR
jgi:hypothetical protein